MNVYSVKFMLPQTQLICKRYFDLFTEKKKKQL